jgi:hypothetical protein
MLLQPPATAAAAAIALLLPPRWLTVSTSWMRRRFTSTSGSETLVSSALDAFVAFEIAFASILLSLCSRLKYYRVCLHLIYRVCLHLIYRVCLHSNSIALMVWSQSISASCDKLNWHFL